VGENIIYHFKQNTIMKKFMPNETPTERLRLLQQNADQVEETKYYRDLTQSELDQKREAFLQNAEKVALAKKDLDAAKAVFKGIAEKPMNDNELLLEEVSTRKALVKGTLFHMANYDEGMMESFDELGDLVQTRRLTPEEKGGQSRLFVAGANNALRAAGE
jgi:hypothetical protein